MSNLESASNRKTVKNHTKVCNLGINGTMKPCCDKEISGNQCDIKPHLIESTNRLTIKMTKEHNDYKDEEKKILGSDGLAPTKYDIYRRLSLRGLGVIKSERDRLKKIIKMRSDWLNKWYVPPSPTSNCYSCDANARNHNIRIEILKKSLDDYNEIILKNEKKKTSVSSRTRSNTRSKQIPKMKLTRRQTPSAMLAKKKYSHDRRKKLYSKKKRT
jgi:hypothetical protein